MRRFGIEPASAVDQAQRDQKTGVDEPFQPLPSPTGSPPYHLTLSSVTSKLSSSQRTLHVIGDHGGVKDPNPQAEVAKAMIADLQAQSTPAELCYSVGDVVYFNGAKAEYPPQFYEAYAHYNLPIFAIPGNHDCDPEEDGEASLQAFMRYFCDPTPQLLAEVAEYNRDTMDQPNAFWTLEDDLFTIVGLYSNVPSGGVIHPDQQEWLTSELRAAPSGRALILALHHPPYCADETTEILTPDGWRRHDEIAPGSVVMTLDHETGQSEWQPCSAVNRFAVADEPMVSIEGNWHSSLTTLEHRWPVLHRRTRGKQNEARECRLEREWKTSETLRSTDYIVTAAECADLPTEATFDDDFVEAVAWFYTEGHVARRYVSAQATITQSQSANPEKVARIRDALTRLHGPATTERTSTGKAALAEPMWREHHEVRGRDDEKVSFWLNTAASAKLLEVAPDKVVSLDFVRALTREQLDLFIDVSLAADGTLNPQSGSGTMCQNRTERLAAFELACILSGRTPHSYEDSTVRRLKDGSFAKSRQLVSVIKGRLLHIASQRASGRLTNPTRTRYTGIVWCPTTSNGSWLARRNGCVFYTGNSSDAHHGGSEQMGKVLDQAFAAAERYPDLVLTGHVHDYQRFTRTIAGRQLPYIVCGAGGYHNLHAMAKGAAPGLQVTPDCVLEQFDATQWGFLRLTITTSQIQGEYVGVDKEGNVTPKVDTFSISVG
jgi:hypothetical protein